MFNKVLVSLLCLFLLVGTDLTAQSKKEKAISYNDQVVRAQSRIGMVFLQFNQGLSTESEDSMRNLRTRIIETIIVNLDSLRGMKSFDGSDELRQSAITLFTFYQEAVSIDYKEVLDLLYAGPVSEERMGKMEDIFARIAYQESKLDSRFQNAQAAFAKKYDFVLEENQILPQIEEDE